VTTSGRPDGPKFHDVTIVRKRSVVGYRTLLARLENARKASIKCERQAQGLALLALNEFLVSNFNSEDKHWRVPFWLVQMASSLTDVDYGKSFSSNTWRKFALISVGMRALTMGGAKREEAAQQAHRAVKTIGDVTVTTLLSRYDEFQKGRVKNQVARHIFNTQGIKLVETVQRSGFEAVAKGYFQLADLA
jgi:hypothetical protein